jgi:Flp pilus assembly protein TadD
MAAKLSLFLCSFSLLMPQYVFSQTRTSNQTRINPTYLISGLVVLDDGTPLEESAEVILICSGVVRQRVNSRPGGHFLISLGEERAPDTDTTETAGNPRGGGFRSFNQIGRGFGDDGRWGSGRSTDARRLYLGDCELIAMLAGYTSDVLYPGNRDVLQNPDVGSIRLHRRTQVSGTSISLKSLTAPEKARNAYSKARKQLAARKPNHAKAVKELEKSVAIYPEYAAAWYLMGKSHIALMQLDKAREAYERSTAADPDYLLPCIGLAELGLKTGQVKEAALWAGRALERNPNLIIALYLYGFASFFLGNEGTAETAIRKVQNSPDAKAYPGTHYVLGTILAKRGDIPSAAAEYRQFLELSPASEGAPELKKQLAEWAGQGMLVTP